jgi:beta-N-acetylhexosaminidase
VLTCAAQVSHMKKFLFLSSVILSVNFSFAQYKSILAQQQWVDSVFNSLSNDEKIAQLIVIRSFSDSVNLPKTVDLIKNYNVGALCFFQGGPIREVNATNLYQSIAKTPLMVTIDAEWGVGMRLDSVAKFPYQLTLGAMNDAGLVYEMGRAVGEQCKRIGVNVNFAPVVDVNNNPNNPVIGYRSFGEDKEKVTRFGLAYMKGMQDVGIMACAKHFPGHGDVDVDSHLDLPVINKSIEQLDSLELKPFKALFDSGVGSVMIAHLYIPAIDTAKNKATSLSKNNVTDLLRISMGFQGLTFTDALEMKGVAKYWPSGEAAVQAVIAGNDMLCLPESVPDAINAIKKAIDSNRLSWNDIDVKLKKILNAKYKLGLNQWKPIDTFNLVTDLNAKTDEIRYRVARQTITMVKNNIGVDNDIDETIPYAQKVAYVSIGPSATFFGIGLKHRRPMDEFSFSFRDSTSKEDSILKILQQKQYGRIIVSVSSYNLRPANNYGISNTAIDFFNKLQQFNTTNYIFGNVLAIKNFLSAKNLIAAYQDDDITQYTAADQYFGDVVARGKLPVSISEFKYGSSAPIIVSNANKMQNKYFYQVDSIVTDALDNGAFPGAVVLAAKNGKIIYEKSYGHYQFNPSSALMTKESIFDLASVTKVSATNVSIMKLYEQGKIKLNKTLGDYLPWTKGTDKAHLKIEDILLHQSGLVPDVIFYRYVRDSVTHLPLPGLFSATEKPGFNIRVTDKMYLRNDWADTMRQEILDSKVGPPHKYVYSDVNFEFLGMIVEAVSKMPLEKFVQKTFYEPMGMKTTGFKPRERFSLDQIVPTEYDKLFRWQLLWGDVHDFSASLFGGVAGHAGLFSDAEDLFKLYQMLLDGGKYKGKRYLKSKTIKLFTAYHSDISRRGYGFDKPEKDNATRKQPYPAASVSPETFGHTGWTGTCVWVDPKTKIVYIFLSNRVLSNIDNDKIGKMSVRGKIHDAIYKAAGVK